MQRVSALLPSWDRSRAHQTAPTTPATAPASAASPVKRTPLALDRVFGWAVPGNRNSASSTTGTPARTSKYGRENYWPLTLDKECDKAARIFKSFSMDGFLVPDSTLPPVPESTDGTEPPSTPSYTTKKIPPRILQNALGLAVFSCVRSGLWMSGSGGAGLITARKADGTWSPPSGIILHTVDLAFTGGVDIYDCILVINSVQTLELFTKPRLKLGIDCSLTVGPLTDFKTPDNDMRWKGLSDTVLTYVKARGRHQAVRLDGSLVTERANENERFYGSPVGVLDILAGNIPKSIPEIRPLFEVIKAAEGRTDYDRALMEVLAQQPAPGDAVIETPKGSPVSAMAPKTPFGIPDADDPDPFGVLSLEMAGIEIREAGSLLRPTSTQFEYNPSPTSPMFSRYNRQSVDTSFSRSNRGSYMSSKTQGTAVTDACTQTDVASTADTTFSRANSIDGRGSVSDKLPTVNEPEEIDYTKIDTSAIERFSPQPIVQETVVPKPAPAPIPAPVVATPVAEPKPEVKETVNTEKLDEDAGKFPADERDEDADDEDEDEDDDEPVICEVATAAPTRTSIRSSQVTQVIHAKGAIVTIPKRIPPPLPARSPARTSRASKTEFGGDVAALRSPLRNSFPSVEPRAEETQNASEGLASEVFVTPPVDNDEKRLETADLDKSDVQGHRKNSSSVCTAVVTTVDKVPEVPPMPRSVDPSSSADESEREPQTPATESGFVNTVGTKNNGLDELSIASPSHDNNTVSLA
ncbi:hypothetical protein OQA88_2210 [Cercophora sp. LCS_1]